MRKMRFTLKMMAALMVCGLLAGCAAQQGAAPEDTTGGSAASSDTAATPEGNALAGTEATPDENEAGTEAAEKLKIICTLFPQYDFARSIAGDEAEVTMLLSPGQEAHMFDPTPSDMEAIASCDLFIYTGDSMEGWAAQIVESLDDEVQVLDLSQYVTLREEDDHDHEGHEGHEHDHGGYDPHYWLDMTNAMAMASAIGDTLADLDEFHAGDYQARTDAYVQQLSDLDAAFMDTVDSSPRKDIVFGGRFAYSYFIARYGLEYESVYHSCSAEADPSVSDMIRVIDYIREHQNTCIFYEELASGNVAKTIAEDVHITTEVFSTGHNVTKSEFDSGITFIELMNRNLTLLKEALAQ